MTQAVIGQIMPNRDDDMRDGDSRAPVEPLKPTFVQVVA